MTQKFDNYVLKCLTMFHTQQSEIMKMMSQQGREMDRPAAQYM